MNTKVSIEAFNEALKSKNESVAFIDVRSPAEFRSMHIKGVTNMPLDSLEKHIAELSKKDAVYVHCKSGARTEKACDLLNKYHLSNIVKMSGGIDDWHAAGLPVEMGKSSISIMRQVQIAAGGLTLSGVILGFAVSEQWFYLSGFVGAGLLFAGVSGTCAMATLLAKMPWNQ